MAEMIKTRINGRWEIILPKHRADRPEWDIANGGWERVRLNSMCVHIKQDDVVFYVGAEEADMCGLVAQWGGKLVMFEPNTKVWPNAKAIWEANGFEAPMACFNGFASNRDFNVSENLHLSSFPPSADGPVIHNHGFCELENNEGCGPQVRIDNLVALTGIIPKHITIDCEGAEFEILRGAADTLKWHRPLLWVSIHPEFMFHHWNEYAYDLRNWIKQIGYRETILDYQHELHVFYEPI